MKLVLNLKAAVLHRASGTVCIAVCILCLAGEALAAASYIDLTHPLPTFEPSNRDLRYPERPTSASSVENFPVANRARPHEDSSGFTGEPTQEYLAFNQPVLGHWGRTSTWWSQQTGTTFALSPNLGTSIDAPAHRNVHDMGAVAAAIGFGLSADDLEPGDTRHVNELGIEDLTGRIVFIDISERVQAEIDEHGGDLSQVDFGIESGNNVSAADIDRVARRLKNGVWLIIRTGWDQFFHDTEAYGNNNNHPGITPEALARLVERENKKRIRINGIGVDNRAVDAGASLFLGGPGSAPAHSIGLSRGWKLLENLTNLGAISGRMARKKLWLIVAPVNLVGAAESYARVYVRTGR